MNHLVFALISSDNPLPIPAPIGLLEILIVLTFILHIIFVNFTISLTAGAVGLEITGMMKKIVYLIKWHKFVLFMLQYIRVLQLC